MVKVAGGFHRGEVQGDLREGMFEQAGDVRRLDLGQVGVAGADDETGWDEGHGRILWSGKWELRMVTIVATARPTAIKPTQPSRSRSVLHSGSVVHLLGLRAAGQSVSAGGAGGMR